MGAHKHSYRLFNIAFAVLLAITYMLVEMYVIPNFVEEKKKAMASSYSGYAFGGILAILGAGSMFADHLDEISPAKSCRHK
uniref:Major facilitator superfamily (MFS) profile domain-containing protein n=1 Tax=viral metagenome TaxID=1070528 RepID=A0A6C0B3N4_9ZZZZ